MIKLGEKQKLTVVKKVEFGVYLSPAQGEAVPKSGEPAEKVLLPAKQVPSDCKIGDELEVFIYRDSQDRMIATTREPALVMGSVAELKVAQVGKIGAFLDWGLEKDLLLPFKQQTGKVKQGDTVLVSLYIDKSQRLCATMNVYESLRTDSPYQKEDMVRGRVYEISDNFGAFDHDVFTGCGFISNPLTVGKTAVFGVNPFTISSAVYLNDVTGCCDLCRMLDGTKWSIHGSGRMIGAA